MEKNEKDQNYKLSSDAVQELLDAQSGESRAYSKEELSKYRTEKKFRIPEWLKVIFIKAWFHGAVCYFIFWGLGTYIGSQLDMLFVLGMVLGMTTNLLVNNILRFMEKTPGESDKWMMVPLKGMGGFLLDLLYGGVILMCVWLLYNVINLVILHITGQVDGVPLGVEPFLFGLFCMGFDMLFIGFRRMIAGFLADIRRAARRPEA